MRLGILAALAACGGASRAPREVTARDLSIEIEGDGVASVVAVQDGDSAWRRVECAGRCSVTIASARYGVAVACGDDEALRWVSILHSTVAETPVAHVEGCVGGDVRWVRGGIANGGDATVVVQTGEWPHETREDGTYEVLAPARPVDLVVLAGRGALTVGNFTTTHVAIERGLPAGDQHIDVDLAMATPTQRSTVRVEGAAQGDYVEARALWRTQHDAMVVLSRDHSAPLEVDRVPPSLLAEGETLRVIGVSRGEHEQRAAVGDSAVTLPAPLGNVEAVVTGAEDWTLALRWMPYEGAAWYRVELLQSTSTDDGEPMAVMWTTTISRGWLAGGPVSYTMPAIDVDGWPASVALGRGVETDWEVVATPVRPGEGEPTYRDAAWSVRRSGRVTP
jgi:hypothetical protein